jgi:beta-N-acetylhexosaminidase
MYMQRGNINIFETPRRRIDTYRYTMKRPLRYTIRTLEREAMEILETVETPSIIEGAVATMQREEQATSSGKEGMDNTSAQINDVLQEVTSIEAIDTIETPTVVDPPEIDTIDTHKLNTEPSPSQTGSVEATGTQELPNPSAGNGSIAPAIPHPQAGGITRSRTVLLIALLCIVVLQATNAGLAQFIGIRGWASVLGGPGTASKSPLLGGIKGQIYRNTPIPDGTTRPMVQITPQQYVDLIVQRMTLDQKLGQMMIVQFVGPSYSFDLSTMINQYGVGAVLIFAANNNIVNKAQLKGLIQQMQNNSTVPMAVAIDQEGGVVDRLLNLDGPRPSEATIGATGDPSIAMAAGIRDAQDLTSYGINLNLAPVVDVTNVYNPQLYTRTYGSNADLVTKMADAYLQGLQKSGKVLGTLKHFPGLGDVGTDPHSGVPHLTRSRSDLERIDWSPYRTLIQQGNVHAIMVTHEIVSAIDDSIPSSLSAKLVTGVLRQEFGFNGVIMTDSLTMDGITAYYTEAQAAALAIEAGSDLLMGAATPGDVAAMIKGIKDAMSTGSISQQRIDDSVRRILMMKYAMGLLPIPIH